MLVDLRGKMKGFCLFYFFYGVTNGIFVSLFHFVSLFMFLLYLILCIYNTDRLLTASRHRSQLILST